MKNTFFRALLASALMTCTLNVMASEQSGVTASDMNWMKQQQQTLDDFRQRLQGAPDKSSNEESRASRVVADLARAEQDMVRQTGDSGRGRMPEIEEQTLTRTIQKER